MYFTMHLIHRERRLHNDLLTPINIQQEKLSETAVSSLTRTSTFGSNVFFACSINASVKVVEVAVEAEVNREEVVVVAAAAVALLVENSQLEEVVAAVVVVEEQALHQVVASSLYYDWSQILPHTRHCCVRWTFPAVGTLPRACAPCAFRAARWWFYLQHPFSRRIGR